MALSDGVRLAAMALLGGALACAGALPACGQSGAAALEPVPGDGSGAFGPASAVEICRAGARIVPPSEGASAAALCVPEARELRACSDDGGCEGIERCVCGRCVVRACSNAASCEGDDVCRAQRCTRGCLDDSACAAGERCASGGCARTCNGDGDCHAGELCDSLGGVCRGVACTAQVACAPGDRCEPVEEVGDVREPEVVELGAETVAYFELRDADGSAASARIHRARVAAAARWVVDPVAPVLAGDAEGEGVGAPSVAVVGGGAGVELYFEVAGGARIERATSADGRSFLRQGVVLAPERPWEAGRVASPAAYAWGGGRWLAYEGGPSAGIGLARIAGSVVSRVSDAPLITPASLEDAGTWRAVTEVGTPYAVVLGDGEGAVLRLYVTARGTEGLDAHGPSGVLPAEPNDSIGMFASRDGESFVRAPGGPVLARIQNLRAHPGEREPCVRIDADGASIVFSGSDATGTRKSGLSRAGR